MSRWTTNYLIIAGGVLALIIVTALIVTALIGASESPDADGSGSPCTPSSQTHVVVQGDGAAALYMTSISRDCAVRVVLVEADIRSVL